MGYKVLYDNQLLFDPYTDDRITDTKLSSKLNAASYFDFTIAPTHSLYSKLAERAGEVRIYFNNLILFKGEITKIDEDFEGNYSVSCTGVLDYLTATRVRPYSTVEGEQPLKAPSSYDGYFQWLINQHNSNCLDSRKRFSVGVNQGNMLDKNNYIYRSSEQRPTTASEIEDKILNSVGGYLFVRYQDDLNILDLYADVHDVNTQIIDYGVNILDFTKTTTAETQYTAVVATGYTPDPPEGQTDVKMKPITLEGCADGGTPYSSTIVKMGDRVYDVEAVARYGYHEYYISNTDIKTYDGLLEYACKTLNTLLSPALTISVRAVDLALILGEKYQHLQLGQAVRVRSKPRKVDEYLMVNSIDLDLMNPENTTFDLGASYDTLTGQQSAYLKALNASINTSLDTVDVLSTDVKNSAKLAQEAKDKADTATDAAADAAEKADKVTDIANSAVSKANAALSESKKYTDAQLKITSDSITSTVSSTYAPKRYPDTRNDNNTPDWYFEHYPNQSITEFKYCSVIGLSGDTYCTLLTEVPWSDATGGYPKQTASVQNKRYWRVGTNGSTWGAWNDALGLATTASSNASTALSTANTVKNDLANLKIGGRNLLLNSNFLNGTSGWSTEDNCKINAIPTDSLKEGNVYVLAIANTGRGRVYNNSRHDKYHLSNTQYSLQFKYKTEDSSPVTFYVGVADTGLIIGNITAPADNTWRKFTATYTSPMTGSLTIRITSGTGRILIGVPKLEYGNKVTDWSPAPEDYSTTTEMQSSINQTAESIKSTVAATYVNNETLSSYATKSQLEQTSTSLTSRIQTTEKTVSGMSTTVKNVNDYMTFARENNQPTLTIGSSSSSFRTKLTNTSEKFMQGDQTIMELDGVTSTVKASRVQMGHYQWRDTGTSLQLVYIPD